MISSGRRGKKRNPDGYREWKIKDSETGGPEKVPPWAGPVKVTTRAGWKPRKKNYEGRPETGKDFLIEDLRWKMED